MEKGSLPKLVLLDRDGVINVDRPDSVKSISEFEPLPNIDKAIARLNEKNIPVVVVTNQAVVGRGDLSNDGLEDIHSWMIDWLSKSGAHIDQIYACTSPESSHPDRKPNPGLLKKALKAYQVEPNECVMVGDALRDFEAAAALGVPFMLVLTGKGEETLRQGLPEVEQPVTICEDLGKAVAKLLG